MSRVSSVSKRVNVILTELRIGLFVECDNNIDHAVYTMTVCKIGRVDGRLTREVLSIYVLELPKNIRRRVLKVDILKSFLETDESKDVFGNKHEELKKITDLLG